MGRVSIINNAVFVAGFLLLFQQFAFSSSSTENQTENNKGKRHHSGASKSLDLHAKNHAVIDLVDPDNVVYLGLKLLGEEVRNKPNSQLSLVAIRNSEIQVIPFQIDEYSDEGLPYLDNTSLKLLGTQGIFDAEDKVLFLGRDAGENWSAQAKKEIELHSAIVLKEIELKNVADGSRYVYLLESYEKRSSHSYVNHDVETGLTNTEYYTLATDPEDELSWQYLSYHSYQGDKEQSLIDTLKMRISGGVLVPVPRITLTNKNLKPKTISSKRGPIRSILQTEIKVVVAKIPVMKMHVQIHRYINHYETHSLAAIPKIFRKTMVKPMISVSLDCNEQYGATVLTAASSNIGYVDGVFDHNDKKIVDSGLSMRDNWMLFDSQKEFLMMTSLDVPDEMLDIPLGVVYQDDKKLRLKPENYIGQLPNFGYTINGMPDVDLLKFSFSLYFGDHLGDMPVESYIKYRKTPPNLVVKTL